MTRAAPSAGTPVSGATIAAVAAFTVIIWGASPFVTKIGTNSADPLLVGFLRTVLAASISVPMILAGRIVWPSTRAQWCWLLGSATSGFCVFPVMYTIGMGLSTAAHGALILAVLPVMTGLIAALLERRLPSRHWWAGCALAILGLGVLVNDRSGFDGGSDPLLGDLLMVAGCAICAFGYVAGARMSSAIGSWSATMWGITLGAAVALPGALVLGGISAIAAIGLIGWLAIAYLAFVVAIIGYALWYWALDKGGVERVAPAQFFQPVVGVSLAVAFLGEALSWTGLAAALVILVGVWVARRR